MPLRMVTIAMFVATLLACGRDSGQWPATTPAASTATATSSTTSPDSSLPVDDPIDLPVMQTNVTMPVAVPVETMFAESYDIPDHIGARSIRLRLKSNVPGASFECRQTAHAVWGTRCTAGNEFWVDNLVHGNTYRFEIRAVDSRGQGDITPLVVPIYIDLYNGRPITVSTARDRSAVPIPTTVSELPGFRASDADRATGSSAVALGPSFAFVLPISHRITSYATDLTYNGRIKLFLSMQPPSGEAPACKQSWERVVAGHRGDQFCDATPRRTDLAESYHRPLPRNHIETYRGLPLNPEEKLFVAAYSDQAEDLDPAEARWEGIDQCPNANLKGNAPLPLVTQQLGGAVREQLSWCLLRASNGDWWWVGTFKGKLAPGKGRIAALYAAKSSTFGIQSSEAFVMRTAELMRKVLVPLGVRP